MSRSTLAEAGRLALLLAASAALLTFDLGRRFLATNDETRFPMLARDIMERGHWLLPQLNGVPHLNKPPLYAWLIALASWPVGSVTQINAAVASIAAGLVTVWATYWIGRRLYGPTAATFAGLIVATTGGVFTLAKVPMPDMALSAAITAAMAAFLAIELGGSRSGLAAFYLLVGVAFWLKGPGGLLPLAVVLVHTLRTDGRAGLRRLVSVPGFVTLGVLIVVWPVLAFAAGGGRFFHEVVVNDLLLWYAGGPRWAWRTLAQPVLLAVTLLLPWSLVLPLALWKAGARADDPGARPRRLLLAWLAVTFVLTALSAQQRLRYYLPLCVPAALLVASWYRALDLRHPRALFATVWLTVAAVVGFGQDYATRRHNGASSLETITRAVGTSPAALYAVDAPALVFAFYLNRPTRLLPGYARFVQRPPESGDEYLVIPPRDLPSRVSGAREIGTDVLNRRPLAVLRRDGASRDPSAAGRAGGGGR